MGHGVEHPIAAFNDLSRFQEANVGLFDRHAEFKNELSEGQTYDSKEEMKAAIYKFHIFCNKEITNTHSDKQRIRFKCRDPRCVWYILARAIGFGKQWKVTRYPTKHVCHTDAIRIDHAQLTATMVADCIAAHMRNDMDLSINAVKIGVAQTYNGQVHCLMLPHIQLVSLDFTGKLLIATGYDAENQLLPLAFSLVDTENFENCAWFMQWLRCNVIRSRFVCVITDRGNGIKKVFRQDDLGWNEEDENECVHHLCATHIAENMKKKCYNEHAIKYFRICVVKRKMRRYEQGMQAMGNVCDRALNWLDSVGKYLDKDKNECPKPWKIFQALDESLCWGIMTANGSE